jgi:hypothetical protein
VCGGCTHVGPGRGPAVAPALYMGPDLRAARSGGSCGWQHRRSEELAAILELQYDGRNGTLVCTVLFPESLLNAPPGTNLSARGLLIPERLRISRVGVLSP